jgi:hypothetical protein
VLDLVLRRVQVRVSGQETAAAVTWGWEMVLDLGAGAVTGGFSSGTGVDVEVHAGRKKEVTINNTSMASALPNK